MIKVLKMKHWIKFVALFIVIFCLVISLSVALDNSYDLNEKICVVIISSFLGCVWFIWMLYLFLFKIKVYDDHFEFRVFFKTRTGKISNITNIDYKRIAFGDYTYIVKFGKSKMEVSQLLKDKIVIDKLLDEKGIFQKYPRVKY